MVKTNFFEKEICLKILYFGLPEAVEESLTYLHENADGLEKTELKVKDLEKGKHFSFQYRSEEKFCEMKLIYSVVGIFTEDEAELKQYIKGTDGVIFLADLRAEEQQNNKQRWEKLLATLGAPGDVPIILQAHSLEGAELLSPEEIYNPEERKVIQVGEEKNSILSAWQDVLNSSLKRVEMQLAKTTQSLHKSKLKINLPKKSSQDKPKEQVSRTLRSSDKSSAKDNIKFKLPKKWSSSSQEIPIENAEKEEMLTSSTEETPTEKIQLSISSSEQEGGTEEDVVPNTDNDPPTEKIKFTPGEEAETQQNILSKSAEIGEQQAQDFIDDFLLSPDKQSSEQTTSGSDEEEEDEDFLDAFLSSQKQPEEDEDTTSDFPDPQETTMDFQLAETMTDDNFPDTNNTWMEKQVGTRSVLPSSLQQCSSEEALDTIQSGKRLENVTVDLLDLSNLSFSVPVHLRRCHIGRLLCDGTDFNCEVVIEDCKITREFTLSGEIGSLFRDDLKLQRTEITGKIYCQKVVAGKAVVILDCSWDTVSDFQHAIFEGSFFLANNKMKGLIASHSRFRSDVTISGCQFTDDFVCEKISVSGKFAISGTHFERARWSGSDFASEFELVNTTFEISGNFRRITSEQLILEGCVFNNKSHFNQAYTKTSMAIRRCDFVGDACFYDMVANGKQSFEKLSCASLVDFSKTSFQQVDFWQNEFKATANFQQTIFAENTSFLDCVFQHNAHFSRAIFIQKVDLTGCEFQGLIALDNIIGDYIIISWNQVEGRLFSEKQKDYARSTQEYLALKKIMEQQGDVLAKDWAHYQAKRAETRALPFSIRQPLPSIHRLFRLIFWEIACGYGTRPRNVFFSLVLIWLFFGAAYQLYFNAELIKLAQTQNLLQFSEPLAWLDSLRFSWYAFIPGQMESLAIDNAAFRMTVQIEKLLGWLLTFVFALTLTRRALQD